MNALPLPVARFRRRSRNAKSAKDRHDRAWCAFEVSIRVAVTASPPEDRGPLARASIGQWCGAMKPHTRPLADAKVLELFAHFTEHGLQKRSERGSITPRELLDAAVTYRNRVIGHGSSREGKFYDEATKLVWAWKPRGPQTSFCLA